MGVVVSHKPSYAEMVKWTAFQWKEAPPHAAEVRPGVFLFKTEQEKLAVWSKKWTFYHSYPIVLKSWNVDRGLDEDSFSLVPVWIQLPGPLDLLSM